ncbi:hypothetical protein H2200_010379 [Cladophialophora chaetospira]|uniref:F-box domain-containing protein n=1 Tax=Cladophialophora chaetospira TaxID=386627 RepID=A0AA38X1G0_9EURO|nr:hypothetical protein H2200_010379 [Cladophialophora chaetospira]
MHPGGNHLPFKPPSSVVGPYQTSTIAQHAVAALEDLERVQSRSIQPLHTKPKSDDRHSRIAMSEATRAGLKRRRNSEEEEECFMQQHHQNQTLLALCPDPHVALHPIQLSIACPMVDLEHSGLSTDVHLVSRDTTSPVQDSALPKSSHQYNIPADVVVGIWPNIARLSWSSRQKSPRSTQHRPNMMFGMDGANDNSDVPHPLTITISRSASVSDLTVPSVRPFRPSMVHFLSDDHLNWQEAARRKERDDFTNPFDPDASPLRRSSSASEVTTYLRPNAFAGHRDTLARLKVFAKSDDEDQTVSDSDEESYQTAWTRQPSVSTPARRYSLAGANLDIFLPERVIDTVLGHLSFDDYKTLRLVCRQWYVSVPQPHLPGAYRLPREILKHIFSYMALWEFDAARHACKHWFLASLDRNVLEPMLKASGCQTGLAADVERLQGKIAAKRRSWDNQLGPAKTDAEDVIDKEWLCSKRLATETRLSPGWRGNSLSDSSQFSRMSLIEEVDFSKGLASPTLSTQARFTVAACGKYVMVVSGGNISVYSLSDPDTSLVPIVRLATGINVVAVSMDTTSERYSVAALLAGRIGMLWDLNGHHVQTRYRSNSGEPMNLGMHTYIQSSAKFQQFRPLGVYMPLRSPEVAGIEDSDPCLGPATVLSAASPPEINASEQTGQVDRRLGIPIETRATAIYTDLGSMDDQPRSVAICPNRKCIAYGCRMGIELHWIDAVTGGDLNRWFPLAAPSDYLYFLPPRPGVDSRRKLRLISSAAGPVAPRLVRSDSSPTKWKYWPSPVAFGRRQSLTRLFFGNLPFPSPAGDRSPVSENPTQTEEVQGVLRTVDCDHFHAIPVSDGFHLVFTDPGSGLLCLGSDAPLGGPTKLVRKLMFIPPDQDCERIPYPLRYAVGKALDWGLRLVVVYDNSQVILYNVPADIFKQLRDQKGTMDIWDENSGVLGQSDLMMDSLMPNGEQGTSSEAHTTDEEASSSASVSSQTLQLTGSIIASTDGRVVDDLAVKSENGGLRVWIFYRNGTAELHGLYAPPNHQVRRSYVGDNGFIYEKTIKDQLHDDPGTKTAKRKEKAEDDKHVKWAGQEQIEDDAD